MIDRPMCTGATPKAVRDLEMEAMHLYRTNFPAATPWHELADTTRFMWVEHAEKQRSSAIPALDKQTSSASSTGGVESED